MKTFGIRIRDENFWDPDLGSGIKNSGIQLREKTSRIRNTGPIGKVFIFFAADRKHFR
jgi:hypothetical protein